MTLYIYRVGWNYLARNPITDLNLQRVPVVPGFQLDLSDRSEPPVRPVGVARPATWSRPVRPLAGTGQTGLFDQCQFWSSTGRKARNVSTFVRACDKPLERISYPKECHKTVTIVIFSVLQIINISSKFSNEGHILNIICINLRSETANSYV